MCLSYTKIISVVNGIKTTCTFFVPINSQRLIKDITVENTNDYPVEIDIIPVTEYTHFEALKQFNNNDWVPQTMQSVCHDEGDGHKCLLQYAFYEKKIQA